MPTPDLDASVIIPSHRGAHRLPAILEALAAQDYPGSWEALIVLDGELDDSATVVKSFADRVPVRLLSFRSARGVCAVLNDGYAAARGRVLIRCDDDLRPAPDMLTRHVRWHQGAEPIGVIGPTRDVFTDSRYATAYGRPANARLLRLTYARPPEQRWVSWAAHNSVTRSTWDRVGGFDPAFVYGQDSELGFRLHRLGVSLVVDEALELPHLGPATSAAVRIPRAFVSGASKRLFRRKHGDPLGGEHHPRPTLGSRLWSLTVSALAYLVTSREGFQRLGEGVQRLLPLTPLAMGGRLVALGVEAAGAAGLRRGPDDLNELKPQKARELGTELARLAATDHGS